MQRSLAVFLALYLAAGFPSLAQTNATPPAANSPVTATAPAVPRAVVPNTLFDGTAVKLRLAENLTSATAKTGDQVLFEVTEEVDVDGVPVIAKGGQALATVTDASPKKSMRRNGKLDVTVDSVRLLNGEKLQLRAAVQDYKGGGHGVSMRGVMVGTSTLLLLPLSAIFISPDAPLCILAALPLVFYATHGKDILIPQGTEVTAFVQGDMKLDMAKFAPAPSVGAVVATASASALTIEASVANCDIEVDGSFMGNTPSTLNLAPGKHEIVVKKAGYKDWTRSVTVSNGTIRVSAEMVAAQ